MRISNKLAIYFLGFFFSVLTWQTSYAAEETWKENVVFHLGLLSLTVGRHIMKRALLTFRQGIEKIKAPEKQLGTIGKNDQKEWTTDRQ